MTYLVVPGRAAAEGALGLVPGERREEGVYLDAAGRERAFGVNLQDAGLDWSRDQAVANTLLVFEARVRPLLGTAHGGRLCFTTMALLEANETLCKADAHRGRDR